MEQQRRGLVGLAQRAPFADLQQQAFSVLTSGKVGQAFAIDRETDQVRDRYGRHLFGQSLLLSRRLIEAGVPIVQANMGRMNNWDTHNKNCKSLQERLLPPLDQAVSALFDDLAARNLFDETLVVMVRVLARRNWGNLGTPAYDPDGRDHWAAFSLPSWPAAASAAGK
jgi:hypothetical protein